MEATVDLISKMLGPKGMSVDLLAQFFSAVKIQISLKEEVIVQKGFGQ